MMRYEYLVTGMVLWLILYLYWLWITRAIYQKIYIPFTFVLNCGRISPEQDGFKPCFNTKLSISYIVISILCCVNPQGTTGDCRGVSFCICLWKQLNFISQPFWILTHLHQLFGGSADSLYFLLSIFGCLARGWMSGVITVLFIGSAKKSAGASGKPPVWQRAEQEAAGNSFY